MRFFRRDRDANEAIKSEQPRLPAGIEIAEARMVFNVE
jgi:hypothetical protein